MPAVDNQRLDRRQQRAAQNRHDQSRGADLRIRPDILQREPVNRREHQAHAGRHTYQAVQPDPSPDTDHHQQQRHPRSRERPQHRRRPEPLHQRGTHEARRAEQDHRHNIVPLAQDLRRLLSHPLGHEHLRAVLDNERPAGNLRADVEELRQDAFAVGPVRQQPPHGRPEGPRQPAVPGAPFRHPHQQHQHEKHRQHNPDRGIRLHDHGQVGRLDGLEGRIVQRRPLRARERIQPRLDQVHRHEHPAERPDRVEALRQVQPPRRRLPRSPSAIPLCHSERSEGISFPRFHRQNKRVRRRLQETQPAGQDEVRGQERPVGPGLRGRQEKQRARGVQPQAHQDAALVAEPPDKERRRQRHAEVPSVKGHLHQRPFRHAHPENLAEPLHHRVRHIIREPPQCKAARNQHKRPQIPPLNRPHSFCLEISPRASLGRNDILFCHSERSEGIYLSEGIYRFLYISS